MSRPALILMLVVMAVALAVVIRRGFGAGRTRAHGDEAAPARGGAGLAPESPVTANATDTALQRIGRNPATKEQAIYWAAIFNNYVTSDGLDTFLSTLRHREWDLDDFTAALDRIGAGALAGILRRADEAYQAYADAEERDPHPIGSPEQQETAKAHLVRMRAWRRESMNPGSISPRCSNAMQSRIRSGRNDAGPPQPGWCACSGDSRRVVSSSSPRRCADPHRLRRARPVGMVTR